MLTTIRMERALNPNKLQVFPNDVTNNIKMHSQWNKYIQSSVSSNPMTCLSTHDAQVIRVDLKAVETTSRG